MSLTAKLESIEPAELARCLFEESRDALFVFDPRDMALVDANPSALEMTCLPRGELLERRLFELLDVDADASLQELMQAFESARPFRSPAAYRLRRGEEPSVSVNVSVSRLGGGQQPLGLFTVRAIDPPAHFVPSSPERKDAELRSGDTTEQKRSDELLRVSEARYRSLVDYAPVCIHGIDLSGRLSSINPAGLKMLSVDDASEVIGREYLSFVEDHDRARVEDLLNQAYQGRTSSFEFSCLVNGESRLFSSNLVPIFADDGAVTALTGTTQDITQRVEIQSKLLESEHRYRSLVDDASEGIVVLDVDAGQFIDFNESASRIFKSTPETLSKSGPWDFSPEFQPDGRTSRDAARQLISRALAGETVVCEWIHCDAEGQDVPCELRLTRFPDENRQLIRGSITNITQRKLAEDQLRERENQLAHVSRLSTMGEMVAGIAHEVNQPLYSIVNFSKAVNNTLNNPANGDLQPIAEWNQQIGAAANRAGQIIKRLRGFISQQPTNRTSVDVSELIADAIDFVKYELNRSGVTLDYALLEDRVAANVDRVQAQQVLVNLLINAIEAVDRDTSAERKVTVSVAVDADQLEISVADTGSGLPDQRQSSIFDAFVSTKPGGMGMGLAISQTIIESFQGRLSARNNEQGGATFSFTLPRVPEDTNHVS